MTDYTKPPESTDNELIEEVEFKELKKLLDDEVNTLFLQAWFLAERKFPDAKLRRFCREFGVKFSTLRKREKVGQEFPRATVDVGIAFGVYEALLALPSEEDRLVILQAGPDGGGAWTVDKMKKRIRRWLQSDEGKQKLAFFGIKRRHEQPQIKRVQGMRVGTSAEGRDENLSGQFESYIRAVLRDDARSMEVEIHNPTIECVDVKSVDGKVTVFLKFN